MPRCVGPTTYTCGISRFLPKGIGRNREKLPDTVADRSILILMSRRAPGERIEKFRTRDAEPIAKPIADALEIWAADRYIQQLRAARPKLPDALGDRAADICEPLLAIADMAGGACARRRPHRPRGVVYRRRHIQGKHRRSGFWRDP